MIARIKAAPSRIENGTYVVTCSNVIHIDHCEQIQVDTGDSVVTYVRAPVPSTSNICCNGCCLSSKHPGHIRGICGRVAGCGRHRLHYIEAVEILEDL